MFEVNKLFIIWLFALFLQGSNQTEGVTGEFPRISQSKRALYRLSIIITQNKQLLILLARVVQKVDNTIHRTNHYPADSVVCFVNTYPLDSIYPVDSAIQPSNNRGLRFCFHQIQEPQRDVLQSYSQTGFFVL